MSCLEIKHAARIVDVLGTVALLSCDAEKTMNLTRRDRIRDFGRERWALSA